MNLVIGQTVQRDYNEELRYQNDAINKMKKAVSYTHLRAHET